MLLELKAYFEKNRYASLQELCDFFHVEEEAMQKILGTLVEKDFLEKFQAEAMNCGQCSKCSYGAHEIYMKKEV